MISNVKQFCKLIETPIGEDNSDAAEKLLDEMLAENRASIHYYSLYSLRENSGFTDRAEHALSLIHNKYVKPFDGTITLTFGEVAESHVGMQKIGKMAERGYNLDDLQQARDYYRKKGHEAFIIHLNEYLPVKVIEDEEKYLEQAKKNEDYQAYVLVVRGGVRDHLNLLTEMLLFDWDTKLYNERRKVVQNKLARYNLNFDTESQEADFAKGKGTTIAWKSVPFLNETRNEIMSVFEGEGGTELKCEGNKYYDRKKTGIGYHGDSERKKVVGVRLGSFMNIHWMWHFNNEPRGKNVSIILQPGDLYCMSEKAVGSDWKPNIKKGWKSKRYSIRHAAGSSKYTTHTDKIRVTNIRQEGKVRIGDISYRKKKGKNNPNPQWISIE